MGLGAKFRARGVESFRSPVHPSLSMHVASCLRIHCALTDSIPVLLSLVWEIEARPRPVAQTKKNIPIPPTVRDSFQQRVAAFWFALEPRVDEASRPSLTCVPLVPIALDRGGGVLTEPNNPGLYGVPLYSSFDFCDPL